MQIIERGKLDQEIENLKELYGKDRSSLLQILRALKEKYGNLSGLIIQETAHALNIHPVEVNGVASFYSFLKTEKTQGKYVIRICQTISCDMSGKAKIVRQLENELGIKMGETTKDGLFTMEYTNCLGMCDQGPALMINDRLFAKVTPEKVARIIADCKRDFLKSEFPQIVPSIVRKKGPILEHGLKVGEGLESALKMSRADVIDTVRKSNLKGRGGAGFPTGAKWQLASEAGGDEKYVICNADEGEPGMFKDRYLLFEQTDLLFDGMTIAGYAIGAKRGLIYLRGEYLYMKSYLDDALQKRKEQGLLGSNILGKQGFDFDIEITMGAGAYVCGEETALIESMEGNRGEPRNRPPFPVISGFKNRPTSVNNVETFVVSAIICAKGSEWFTKFGTESSSGTKLFSVSGDCENPGIYELPLGITINELLETVGAKDTKAVQIGGASGQCIAKVCFDHKISYEDIPSGGSIIIFDSNRDMLNVAKNFVEFFVEESCGQCTPCREGNVKLLEGLKMMEEGRCSVGYMEELVKLGETIQNASKCFLGRSCPNAFLSIVKNFKDELLGRVPESV